MDIPLSILLLTIVVCVNNTELSAKYLHDTIKDLKLKTNTRNINPNSQPSLNTLSIRRVYTPPQEMVSFGQSHDSLASEVDKIMDNVASMVSAASEDKEDIKSPPHNLNYDHRGSHGPHNPPESQAIQGTQGTQPVPNLHLTKSELASLYANAVHKGATIKLDGDDTSGQPLTAAVHEVDSNGNPSKPNLNAAKKPNDGYYYYYYPLKSFMDELSSSPSGLTLSQNSSGSSGQNTKSIRKTGQFQNAQTYKTPSYHHPTYHHHHDPYYHSHTHQDLQQSQHNVHFDPPRPMMMDDKKKGLEPLFMAISGFIGMTVMFILSVLVLPKFKKLKPKGLRREDEEFYGIGRVALEAIDGYDCTERFACEAGKTANAFGLYNNRFVKLLRRIGPITLVKQINRVGKYTNKKYRCGVIRCKEKANKPELKL